MKVSVKGELLEVSIRGNIDFEKARQLLQLCKTHSNSHDNAKLKICLEQASSLNSCTLGAFLIISEWMPGGCDFNIIECSQDINGLFSSGMLNKYFSQPISFCITCFEQFNQAPDKECATKFSENHSLKN